VLIPSRENNPEGYSLHPHEAGHKPALLALGAGMDGMVGAICRASVKPLGELAALTWISFWLMSHPHTTPG
jgi:hypothetical protein